MAEKTHGMSRVNGKITRLYRIWTGIKQRCYNNKNPRYKDYGGRGITVCTEWVDYLPFHEWAMSNKYSPELTLDRKNNNGNYEPSNCRWLTIKQQQNNRGNNRIIEYNGKTQNTKQWTEELGMRTGLISERIDRYGWSVERALTEPINTAKRKTNKHK